MLALFKHNRAIVGPDFLSHLLCFCYWADRVLTHVHVSDRDPLNILKRNELLALKPAPKDIVVGKLLESVLQGVLSVVQSLLDADFLVSECVTIVMDWTKIEAAQKEAFFAVVTYKGAKDFELLLPFRPKE